MAKAKKKYYAVAVGRQPGIYEDWLDAESQVKAFPGAKFKGFSKRSEAGAWLADPVYHAAPGNRQYKPRYPRQDMKPKDDEITIYTDGGSINNPGPGGYGVVIVDNGAYREFSGGYRLTTNNRMELMGCIVALRKLSGADKPVALYSDSSYVVNGINKGWARKWRQNGWLKSDKRPALNTDLWDELLTLSDKFNIRFNWVKGHAGNPLNERCDELAVAAARRHGQPEDVGYSGKLQREDI
ncbi:MAG: ribonuclease HI [Deltaproteobacteria bacterium]|nr:ribonuclease HI [Deltaproteobacteria bacterium]